MAEMRSHLTRNNTSKTPKKKLHQAHFTHDKKKNFPQPGEVTQVKFKGLDNRNDQG